MDFQRENNFDNIDEINEKSEQYVYVEETSPKYVLDTLGNEFEFSDKNPERIYRTQIDSGFIEDGRTQKLSDAHRDERMRAPMSQSLEDFATGGVEGDQDIYDYYRQNQGQTETEDEKKERLLKERVKEFTKKAVEDQSIMHNHTPTFQEYEERQRLRQSTFGDDTYELQEDEEKVELLNDQDSLTSMEWWTRLYGDRLSADQFQLLHTSKSKLDQSLKDQTDFDGDKYLSNQNEIEIGREMLEELRRGIVENEYLSEEESHGYIKNMYERIKMYDLDKNKHYAAILKWQKHEIKDKGTYNSQYYFDEDCGQTLDEHIKMVEMNPKIKVQVLKDKDHNTVIRYQKKYKYNLDEMLEEELNSADRSGRMNKLLKPFISHVKNLDFDGLIKSFNQHKTFELMFKITRVDGELKGKFDRLVELRGDGEIGEEAYMNGLKEIQAEIDVHDQGELFMGENMLRTQNDKTREQYFDEGVENAEIVSEFIEQILDKQKETRHFTKLEDSDFVTSLVDEERTMKNF